MIRWMSALLVCCCLVAVIRFILVFGLNGYCTAVASSCALVLKKCMIRVVLMFVFFAIACIDVLVYLCLVNSCCVVLRIVSCELDVLGCCLVWGVCVVGLRVVIVIVVWQTNSTLWRKRHEHLRL